jgi:hypothetical protein
LLTSGYFGHRLVDRVIAALFCRRGRGSLRDALPLQALTVRALRSAAMRAVRTALVAISAVVVPDRLRGAVVIIIALAGAPVGIQRLALPIVALEVQAELIVRLAVAAARGNIAIAIVLPIVAEGLTPLIFAALLFAPQRFVPQRFAPVLFPPFLFTSLFSAPLFAFPLLSAPLVFGHAIAGTPRRLAITITCVIVVARPLAPFVGLTLAAAGRSAPRALGRLIVALALLPWLVGVTVTTAPRRSRCATRFWLWIIIFGARLRAFIRLAIAGPPRVLVILIGRLDDSIEPLADRHARSTRGRARRRARHRTETS